MARQVTAQMALRPCIIDTIGAKTLGTRKTMSLTDKVIEELRDETYAGGLVDREEADELADNFGRLTASADAPFGAQRMLTYAAAAEVLAVALVWFGMRYLLQFFGDVYIAVFGTAFVFLTGFFGAFAAYKLYNEYIARDIDIHANDGPMSDIADYDASPSGLTLYLVSAAGGIANLVLVSVLISIKNS
jgi:hypothetical protein